MPPTDDELIEFARQARVHAGYEASLNAAIAPDPTRARADSLLQNLSRFPLPIWDSTTRDMAEMRVRQDQVVSSVQRAPALGPYLADPRNYALAADDLHPLSRVAEAAQALPQRRGQYPYLLSTSPRSFMGAIDRPDPISGVIAASPGRYGGAGFSGLARFTDGATPMRAPTIGMGPYAPTELRSYRLRNPDPIDAVVHIIASAGNLAGQGLAGAGEALYDVFTLRAFGLDPRQDIENELRRQGRNPDDFVRSSLHNIRDYYRQSLPQIQFRTGNEYIDAAIGGLESVPIQLTAIGAAATGNPGAALAMMATVTGGQAYSEARDAGLSPGRALVYAGIQGGLEAAGEMLPVFRFADDAARGSGILRTLGGQLLTEIPGEQFTQHAQDFETWAAIEANQGKTLQDYLAERPRVARDTLIATIAAVGMQTTAGHVVARAARRASVAGASAAEDRALDALMSASAESRLRRESPADFSRLLEHLTGGNESIYVPAEQVRALFQTPEEMAADTFWGDYVPQINEAEALHGDVVVPLSAAATHLAGSPQWEALKDHVRTSAGGMSRAEAVEAEHAFFDAMQESGQQLADEMKAEAERMAPVEKVHEAMRDKLLHAGFRLDVANQLAEQFAQRQRVRAERLGRPLTGAEADAVDVRQVLPQNLARAISAENVPDAGLRAVIAAMRGKQAVRSDRTRFGPSLIEFLAKRGGIEDIGGELAHMGFGSLGKGFAKKGQKKLIRQRSASAPTDAEGRPMQESMDHSFERALEAAVDAGYFPNVDARQIAEAGDVSSLTIEPLLEALRDELAGKPRYAETNDNSNEADNMRMAAQELYALLDQQGIDPEKATEAEIMRTVSQYQAERSAGRGYDQGLFTDPAQPERTMTAAQRAELEARQQQSKARRGGQQSIKDQEGGLFSSERDQSSLFQSFGDGPRGRITFGNGKAVIDLFEARDLSTFIHESGHLYLEELKADAEIGRQMDTPEGKQLAKDFDTVKAWFAKEGHPIADDGTIPTEAHEMFARGFERYAMEGKAPSSGLKRAFEAFRSWLLNIYKNVTSLRAPITPEIRDVMARMLATDEEIASANVEQAIKLGFTSAKDAGMTDAEFKAYQNEAATATSEAHDALLKKVMATVRAARTKEYRAQEAEARAEIAQAVDAQPVLRALAMLRKGDKLDRQFLIDSYGKDALDRMPRSVPPIYAEKGLLEGGFVHPDVIAEEAGFASGDEMIRALMDHEAARKEMRANGDKRSPRKVQIDEGTAKVMAEQYGDPLRDGTIEEEARAIIHNEKQGEVFAAELRALSRTTGKRPTPYRIAREWANERIAAGQVQSVASGAAIQNYLRAAAKAGREFEQALAKGDRDAAFKHKQAQMLNNALVAAAREAKDRIDVAVRRLGKLAKAKTRASMDQDYLDQIHGLLEQVELRPRSQASLEEQQSYEAWAEGQREAGIDLVNEPSFVNSLGKTHWSRLSVEQLIGLDDTVQQIAHLGRLKQTLLDGQERRAFEEIIAETENAAGLLPPKPPSDLMEPSFGERMKGKVASFDAALLKMETVFDWLDSKKSAGVFNRIVFKPIADAQTRAADMFSDYMGKLNEALKDVPKRDLRRWGDRVTPPELLNRKTGNPYTMTRQQLVSMALNMGNEGNAQRLADGYGWNEDAIMAVLNRELSAEEWNYVQSVWDIIDGLWPHIEAMEKNVNGVAPEKVEARPLETSAGSLKGGYFPAVYDSSKDYTAERNAARESDLFETTYTRATTRASATKDRAEKVSRPILLNLGVITRHIGEVTHDIAYREAVMNADKFLSHPRIMAAVDSTLGPEIRKQFRPWLKFVANQWAMERAGNEGIGAFMNKLRTNTTVVGMGYRFSTMIMQLAGYSNSFEVVGAKWVSAAVAQTSAHPVETFKFVMDRSGEMRHRMDTLDRDIDQGIRRLAGKTNPLTDAKRFAYHGIGYMDRVVVIPTWIGAYNKALAAGSTDEEAIYDADKAVRQSQGAGAAKDMAAVQRGTGKWGEALKLTTMFYSYLSAVWQRQRTLGRDVRNAKPRDLPGIAARAWWLIVLPPVLSELMGGRGPDDDEDWTAWATKQMLFQMLGAIPVVRDVARPAWDKAVGNKAFDYQLSPVQRAGQSAVNVAGDLGRIVRGEDTAHATRDTLEALGYWTGLVPGQFASATQFLVDVGSGEAEPETVGDWYEGLTKGRLHQAH